MRALAVGFALAQLLMQVCDAFAPHPLMQSTSALQAVSAKHASTVPAHAPPMAVADAKHESHVSITVPPRTPWIQE